MATVTASAGASTASPSKIPLARSRMPVVSPPPTQPQPAQADRISPSRIPKAVSTIRAAHSYADAHSVDLEAQLENRVKRQQQQQQESHKVKYQIHWGIPISPIFLSYSLARIS